MPAARYSLGGAQAEVPIASLPGRDGLPQRATVVAASRADSPGVCANVCSATPAGRPGAMQGAQAQGPNPAAMLAGLSGAQVQGAQVQGPNPAAMLAGRSGAPVQSAQVQGPSPAARLAGLPGAQAQGAQVQGPNPAAKLAGLLGATQSASNVPVGATNGLPQVPSFAGSMPLPPQAQTHIFLAYKGFG